MKRPPKKLWIPVLALALVAVLWHPVRAGIDSLWMDDATLAQQLVQLIKIEREMQAVSDGVMVTAHATQDIVHMYDDLSAAVDELQHYGPEALWRDFRRDLYAHYPGFQYLEGNHNLADKWKLSRSKSPVTAYEMIGAVFGDLSAPLRKKERSGELDTTSLRLRRFEGAGALSQAADAEDATKEFDKYAGDIYDQARDVRSGEEAQVLSAKAVTMIAAQNSYIIRLLSRRLRLDGIEEALKYKSAIQTQNAIYEDMKGLSEFEKRAVAGPKMMEFPSLFDSESSR